LELDLLLEPEAAKPFQESNLRVTSFRFVSSTSAAHRSKMPHVVRNLKANLALSANFLRGRLSGNAAAVVLEIAA
jgi:hypothetical protein